MTEPRAYLRDLRALKMCASGARRFAARHGIDWDDFRHHGIPVSRLDATGDAMALKLAEIARGRIQ